MASQTLPARKKRRVIRENDDSASQPTSGAESPPAALALTLTAQPQKLSIFEQREDVLRAITTCKVCFRMLYEPYTLGCGHTYCYSCLCQWFTNGENRKKTCPDCRTAVMRTPAPAYALRDIVRELLNRAELLPESETVEEHERAKLEEAAIVDEDKADDNSETGGLFKGRFPLSRNVKNPLRHLRPIHDDSDGVHRCPQCLYEIEPGEGISCGRCGWEYSGSDEDSANETGSLDEDEELDADLDMDDEEFEATINGTLDHLGAYDSDDYYPGDPDWPADFDEPMSMRWFMSSDSDSSSNGVPAPRRRNRDGHLDQEVDDNRENEDDDDDDDDDDDEADSSMEGFIDDDEEQSLGESESSSSTTIPTQTARNARHRVQRVILDSDDEEEEADGEERPAHSGSRPSSQRRIERLSNSPDPENGRSNDDKSSTSTSDYVTTEEEPSSDSLTDRRGYHRFPSSPQTPPRVPSRRSWMGRRSGSSQLGASRGFHARNMINSMPNLATNGRRQQRRSSSRSGSSDSE